MSNRSTNRHGIPRYAAPKALPTCRWPDCRNPLGRWALLSLCDPHVRVVVEKAGPELMPAADRPGQGKTSDAPREGTVYFLRSGGHIKIGWTSDLAKRMRTYPPDSTLLAHHPGTRKDEQCLHRKFAVHRTHGREWYTLSPVILEHIKGVVAEHGQPDTVDFGAKPVAVPQPHRQRQGPRPRTWISGSGQLRAG